LGTLSPTLRFPSSETATNSIILLPSSHLFIYTRTHVRTHRDGQLCMTAAFGIRNGMMSPLLSSACLWITQVRLWLVVRALPPPPQWQGGGRSNSGFPSPILLLIKVLLWTRSRRGGLRSSVVKCLPSMLKALCSIHSTREKERATKSDISPHWS
jgi:hypothetical protein